MDRYRYKYPGHGAVKFLTLEDIVKDVDTALENSHILTGKELEAIGQGIKRAKFIAHNAMAFEVALGATDVYPTCFEMRD